MVWNLSVIITYADGSWESAELILDEKGGYRSFGPDVSALPQVQEFVASLGLTPAIGSYYRTDVTDVTLRFSSIATNGEIYTAGATEDVVVYNNLEGIQGALESDPYFSDNVLKAFNLYMFDYDRGSPILPLYVNNNSLKIGGVWKDIDILTGYQSRWSAIAEDLSGVFWVVNVTDSDGTGFLRRLDSNFNVAESFALSEAIYDDEAIKLVAYDEDRFLLVQEDENVYYLDKSGNLTTIYNLSQSDPLSLFRHNGEIFMLQESNTSIRKWNPNTERFEVHGVISFSDSYVGSVFDLVGTVLDPVTGKYIIFVNREDGWHYANLDIDTLVVAPLFKIYGVDDDVSLIRLPVAVPDDSLGYSALTDRFTETFYGESGGVLTFSLDLGFFTADKISPSALILEYNTGSGWQNVSISSVAIDTESTVLVTAVTPDGFIFGNYLRIRYASDTSGRNVYISS